jgi:hypothetical protein
MLERDHAAERESRITAIVEHYRHRGPVWHWRRSVTDDAGGSSDRYEPPRAQMVLSEGLGDIERYSARLTLTAEDEIVVLS